MSSYSLSLLQSSSFLLKFSILAKPVILHIKFASIFSSFYRQNLFRFKLIGIYILNKLHSALKNKFCFLFVIFSFFLKITKNNKRITLKSKRRLLLVFLKKTQALCFRYLKNKFKNSSKPNSYIISGYESR